MRSPRSSVEAYDARLTSGAGGAALVAGAVLDEEALAAVRRRTIFECGKWDPQAEDVSVLAPFPLLLDAAAWAELSRAAERLYAETLAAEAELLERPEWWRLLALPRAVRAVLSRKRLDGAGPRFMRFDFHPTAEGWRISEVNSDVPGGFIEAAGFTQLMAEHCDGAAPAGDPAAALAEAALRAVGPGATVALVHATAYTDDAQVMLDLGRRLEQRGLRPVQAAPDHLHWRDADARAAAWLEHGDHRGPVDLIVRFFPAEWLLALPRGSGWRHYFTATATPQSNPGAALLTQSKRFALAWDALRTPLPAWRALLPETRDPRDAPWRRDESWLLKPALGRVGEGVSIADVTPAAERRAIARAARWFPRHWAAQRRFEPLAVATPEGERFPALGVFVIDGRAAGIYGRLARRPLVDHRAQDVAVLVRWIDQ